ncbi:MAG: sigma-70 family RNA polymerase sigma factor [Kofleriaceae bacterium]|nr:sigma-70 family RNA polymerase sigma factor [Kofleriaceae bacterium]
MTSSSELTMLAESAGCTLPVSEEECTALSNALSQAQRSLAGRLPLSVAELGRILARRLNEDKALVVSSHWHWDELYIADRALRGDDAAIEIVDAMLRNAAGAALGSRGFSQTEIEEAIQQLLTVLLVPGSKTSSKLDQYSGRGSLSGFLRTAVVRLALNARRGESRHQHNAYAQQMEAVLDDPELRHLKQNYLETFREALESAIDTLPAEKKLALRLQFEDRLTIDDLARLWGVHRSTAARRLASARDTLAVATREQLKSKLSLDDSDVQSVMNLIQSRLGDAASALS